MKLTFVKILVITSAVTLFGCDQPEDQKENNPINGEVSNTNMNEFGRSAQKSAHKAVGTVIMINKEKSQVMVDLEPVPELNWTAESIPFQVEDEEELDDIQQGDRVTLSFVEAEPGRYVAQELTER